MECNKEEACKAKAIAEKKFTETDITGAKRFAVKARTLYPNLDGLTQLLATLNVYISSQRRTDGEVDWYGVLGVEPSAEYETIRKQYRNMALILHPDKNKSVGAEGAFKILSEAWSLLSDKAKRIAYDQKCNLRRINHEFRSWKSSTSTGRGVHTTTTAKPTGPNGFHNLYNADARTRRSATHENPSQVPSFWTKCNSCKTLFEYLRDYVNQNLLCQGCHQPFFAVEVPPPPIKSKNSPSVQDSYSYRQNHAQQTRNDCLYSTGQKPTATNMGPTVQSGTSSISGSVGNVKSAASAAAVSKKLKRKRDQAPMSWREELLRRKQHVHKKSDPGVVNGSSPTGFGFIPEANRQNKIHFDEHRMSSSVKDRTHQISCRSGEVGYSGSANGVFGIARAKAAVNNRPYQTRELSTLEVRNMLFEKAKKGIREKLKEWSSVSAVLKTLDKEIGKRENEMQKAVNVLKADANKCPEFTNPKPRVQTNESSPVKDELEMKAIDAMSMNVPDPDFHDFDKDRREKSFGENQVWAAYDDDDGMPRFYAMVHGVTSWKPFKMQISWLNSKSNRELGTLNWIGSGFYKTSGEFWVGKHEGYNSINSFSHKVTWTKGIRGAILIYPRKGDVWALYKNWSPDWNEFTSDEVIHKYEMIEVLEDYGKDIGVTVAPLVKVAGYKTVFCRHPDFSKTRTIPREEMFRLSHQVPNCLLTGQEGTNAPKGCLELDPASLPLELLQVCTEEQLEEMLKTGETFEGKDSSGNQKKIKGEQPVESTETTKVKEDAIRLDSARGTSRKVKGTKSGELLVYRRRKLMQMESNLVG